MVRELVEQEPVLGIGGVDAVLRGVLQPGTKDQVFVHEGGRREVGLELAMMAEARLRCAAPGDDVAVEGVERAGGEIVRDRERIVVRRCGSARAAWIDGLAARRGEQRRRERERVEAYQEGFH